MIDTVHTYIEPGKFIKVCIVSRDRRMKNELDLINIHKVVNPKPSIHANNCCKILTVHINVSFMRGGKRRRRRSFSSCRKAHVYVHSKNLTTIIRMN